MGAFFINLQTYNIHCKQVIRTPSDRDVQDTKWVSQTFVCSGHPLAAQTLVFKCLGHPLGGPTFYIQMFGTPTGWPKLETDLHTKFQPNPMLFMSKMLGPNLTQHRYHSKNTVLGVFGIFKNDQIFFFQKIDLP